MRTMRRIFSTVGEKTLTSSYARLRRQTIFDGKISPVSAINDDIHRRWTPRCHSRKYLFVWRRRKRNRYIQKQEEIPSSSSYAWCGKNVFRLEIFWASFLLGRKDPPSVIIIIQLLAFFSTDCQFCSTMSDMISSRSSSSSSNWEAQYCYRALSFSIHDW